MHHLRSSRLALNPDIARDTLRYLARRQGAREDPFTEEQPGKILHELRRGEMARAGEIPHVPYYGTRGRDASLAGPASRDLAAGRATTRWCAICCRNAERALEWIDQYGDQDGDGFVEYPAIARRVPNQGWKDSGDGMPSPRRPAAEPPIALVEVQGYVYDAKVRMSDLFRRFGQPERAAALASEADALRGAISERFWMDESGTFALALDGSKGQVSSVTSNPGHLLWSRVPTAAQARSIGPRDAGAGLVLGLGHPDPVRSRIAVSNPMSYHQRLRLAA